MDPHPTLIRKREYVTPLCIQIWSRFYLFPDRTALIRPSKEASLFCRYYTCLSCLVPHPLSSSVIYYGAGGGIVKPTPDSESNDVARASTTKSFDIRKNKNSNSFRLNSIQFCQAPNQATTRSPSKSKQPAQAHPRE